MGAQPHGIVSSVHTLGQPDVARAHPLGQSDLGLAVPLRARTLGALRYRPRPSAQGHHLRRGLIPSAQRLRPHIMAAFRNLTLTLIRRTGTTEIAAFRQHLRSRPTKALRLLDPGTRSA